LTASPVLNITDIKAFMPAAWAKAMAKEKIAQAA
jgi:hypothetical protein